MSVPAAPTQTANQMGEMGIKLAQKPRKTAIFGRIFRKSLIS
jgi:hypothetical protein